MDCKVSLALVEEAFRTTVVDRLCDYIRIPNQSPHYDPHVLTNGHQDRAIELLLDWVRGQSVEGLSVNVVREQGRTPVILLEVPHTQGYHNQEETILLYGHMDKQPPLTEQWAAGLHPYTPVIRDGKLYGRGGADDGYSTFSAVLAVKCLQASGAPHPRISILIEAGEESGSPDLNHYLAQLKPRLGDVSLIICLDSGCGNYDQLWLTTSLRGVCNVTVKVGVMKSGVHSGSASGVVPSSFRGMRNILDALEDAKTGRVLLPELWVDIPPHRVEEAHKAASFLGPNVFAEFPLLPGVKLMHTELPELMLNRTWRPTLSYTGVDGIPSLSNAGNVLRAQTTLVLSFRLPPDDGARGGACGH